MKAFILTLDSVSLYVMKYLKLCPTISVQSTYNTVLVSFAESHIPQLIFLFEIVCFRSKVFKAYQFRSVKFSCREDRLVVLQFPESRNVKEG